MTIAAPLRNNRNCWLYTGDIGRFDEAGYLYIVDRNKDMNISGGENVGSREVEEVYMPGLTRVDHWFAR